MATTPGGSPTGATLPLPLTSLVAREAELERIRTMMRDRGVRLLTLTGPGGVGKTRLALAATAKLAEDFAHGARFLPLAALSAVPLVETALAHAIGLRQAQGSSLAERLHAEAAHLELLLLVDNFEHLLPAAPVIAEILAASTSIRCIVTSRERLRLSGEHEFPVLPLACPDPERCLRPAELATAPAVRLFTERARAVDPMFALDETNVAAVAAICHRLDGVPLAIELAAARVAHFPPPALLTRLAHRLPLLTAGPRDAPARLRTMRDAIAWSYDLIDPTEQRIFRALAVFAGGFTPDAAELVAGGAIERRQDAKALADGPSVLDSIASLVDKNLVRVERPTGGRGRAAERLRYSMLETIREYALEQLIAAGEGNEVRGSHANWVLDLVEASHAAGGHHSASLQLLERERENILAALTWYLANEQWPTLLLLTSRLGSFWCRRGYQTEGKDWLQTALARAPNGDPILRTAVLNALGTILRDLGELSAARSALEEALVTTRDSSDPVGEATALNSLTAIADDVGDLALQHMLAEASVFKWRAIGDPLGLARALQGLAWAQAGRKNMSAATELMRDALSHAREAGDEHGVAHMLASLGTLLVEQRRFMESRPHLQDGLALATRAGDRDEMIEIQVDLAWVALELDQPEAARSALTSALALLRTGGRKRDAVIGLEACALVAADQGKHDLALRLVASAATVRAEMGIPLERDPRIMAPAATTARTALRRLVADAADCVSTWSLAEALLAAEAVVSVRESNDLSGDRFGLTRRERDVLRLLAAGKPDHAIAAELFISRKTASNHVSSILAKLDAASRTEAAATALRAGLA